MALPFVPCQCSSPHVDECLWDALALAVPVFLVHTVDVWKHLFTHIIPPVRSSKSYSWLSPSSEISPSTTSKLANGLGPASSILTETYFLRWDFHSEERRSALMNEEYVRLDFQTATTVCVGMFLNAGIPLDWMDRFTQALSTSAVHKDFNQPVCLSVCHLSTVSHLILPLFQWGLFVL